MLAVWYWSLLSFTAWCATHSSGVVAITAVADINRRKGKIHNPRGTLSRLTKMNSGVRTNNCYF